MMMFKILKNQWFGILIIFILLWMQCKTDKSIILYKEQVETLKEKIKEYQEKDKVLNLKIDSLSNLEVAVVERIKTIKQKEYVQIKMVDILPTSKLQKFFTGRYPD